MIHHGSLSLRKSGMARQKLAQRKPKVQKDTVKRVSRSNASDRAPKRTYPQSQGIIGNHGLLRRFGDGVVQAKLMTGSLSSSYGRKEDVASAVDGVLSDSGQPLDATARAFMESRFGRDFRDVRVHTDERAAASAQLLKANAYTVGQDLVFQRGRYAPGTRAGRLMLAHELTHVLQQRFGSVDGLSASGGIRISQPSDSFEQEADRTADQIVSGQISSADVASHRSRMQRRQPAQRVIQRDNHLVRYVHVYFATPPEQLIIREAVRLAESDETLLRPEDVRTALESRDSDPDLSQRFTDAEQAVRSSGPSDWRQVVSERARELIRFLELRFIRDPEASTLDLLPPEQGRRYRETSWAYADFPGGQAGPHEHLARQMRVHLTGILPERRPHMGSTRIMSADQEPGLRSYILSELRPIPGQSGQRLNRHALEAFIRMRDAARADGVELIVRNSFRTRAASQAAAAGAGNPEAVAEFSAHNLGLAIDFQMSTPTQHFAETTTRPMQNLVNMRQSAVHKWLFLNARRFGWSPYHNEPWHWEYNPPGFTEQFYENHTE